MLGFLGGVALVVVLLGLLMFRVTACAPPTPRPETGPGVQAPGALPVPPAPKVSVNCRASGWEGAANINASSLRALPWAPFRRPEVGWEVYAPLIAREVGAACAPDTPGFAAAYAAWQKAQLLPVNGIVSDGDFQRLRGIIQSRRQFVRNQGTGICPEPPPEATLEWGRAGEGYSGKPVQLRPAVFAAYRQMVAAAKAEDSQIAADPRNLTIFSAYRSPDADAARCAKEGNCDGIVRAACSPHRTGLAMDIYVGQAPGFGPDSSADPNRLFMTKTATYRWMLANAHRFGFVNYPLEPWHWEWTGEAP